MITEKLLNELLGLGLNWEVVDSRFEKERATLVIEIRETQELWKHQGCPKEGGKVTCYDHVETLTWRHLNIFEYRCEIQCKLPRGKCDQCGHVYRVRPPWEGMSLHFTKGFEAYALVLMKEMPMLRVAKLVGETDTRLWRMLFAHVDAAYEEADFSNVCCVGVDEMSARKGHDYLTVFADLVAKRVLFATEGKDQETWAAFVETLEKHNGHRHAINQVSMDMSKAYQAGVAEYCHGAQEVFDKFHVIKNANEAVDKVRQKEVRLGGQGVWDALNKSQWLWRKIPESLTEKEKLRLANIEDKNLMTAKAYQMRLVLQDIYKLPQESMAKRRLQIWCRWVSWVGRKYPEGVFTSMIKLANMIENHLTGILAHWKWHLTNAFMEGLNSVFSAVKRKARGFRSSTYLITTLYLVAGKLRIPYF